eukprot:Hpha_TRINITY_DN15221_c1_g2::TRINITY_DN15221_c1_g2_i1::g.66455::m.66455
MGDTEETRDFAWPTPPDQPSLDPVRLPGETTCAEPCHGKGAGVGCQGMKTWNDWHATSGCTSTASQTCVTAAAAQGYCSMITGGLSRNADGSPLRANKTVQDAAVLLLEGIPECKSSYCNHCQKDVPDYLYVGCNPEHDINSHVGDVNASGHIADCRQIHVCLRAHCEGWTTLTQDPEPLPLIGGCPCDYSGQSGFMYTEQSLGDFEDSIPALGRSMPIYEGRYAHYPQRGYYFDLYSTMDPASVQRILACYQAKDWIDAYTRQLQIQFYTYNPFTNLFLNHLVFLELPASGHIEVHIAVVSFEWNPFEGTPDQGLDIVVFIFVCYFVFRYFWDWVQEGMAMADGTLTCERIMMPLASVWRWVDTFNLAAFLYVYVLKFTYFQAEHVTLASFGDGVPEALIKDPKYKANMGRLDTTGGIHGEETIWPARATSFESSMFEFLGIYSSHTLLTNRLQAVTALLSFLRLFMFISYNPRMNLLTETIKESAIDFISLLLFVGLITLAFAYMGHILFAQVLDDYSELGLAFESLLRMAIGDFDYDELLSAPGMRHTKSRIFVVVFFFGYQGLVWLILLNMVIGIVSDAFAKCKERQKHIIGQQHVGSIVKDFIASVLAMCEPGKDTMPFRIGLGCPRGFPEPCTRIRGVQVPLRKMIMSVGKVKCSSESVLDVVGAPAGCHKRRYIDFHDGVVCFVGEDNVFHKAGVRCGMKVLEIEGHRVGLRRKAVCDAFLRRALKKAPSSFQIRVCQKGKGDDEPYKVEQLDLEQQFMKDNVCGTRGVISEPFDDPHDVDDVTRSTVQMLLWFMSDGKERCTLGVCPDNRSLYSVHSARICYQEQVIPSHARHSYRQMYWAENDNEKDKEKEEEGSPTVWPDAAAIDEMTAGSPGEDRVSASCDANTMAIRTAHRIFSDILRQQKKMRRTAGGAPPPTPNPDE